MKPLCMHTKLVPDSENLGIFWMGRCVSGMPCFHNLSAAPRPDPAHTGPMQVHFAAFFTPSKEHIENFLGYIPVLAPSLLTAQLHQALPCLILDENGCLRLVGPKEDSP